jgi:hypothetical protein
MLDACRRRSAEAIQVITLSASVPAVPSETQIRMDYGAEFSRGRLFIFTLTPAQRESGAGTVVAPRVTDRWSLGNLRG